MTTVYTGVAGGALSDVANDLQESSAFVRAEIQEGKGKTEYVGSNFPKMMPIKCGSMAIPYVASRVDLGSSLDHDLRGCSQLKQTEH